MENQQSGRSLAPAWPCPCWMDDLCLGGLAVLDLPSMKPLGWERGWDGAGMGGSTLGPTPRGCRAAERENEDEEERNNIVFGGGTQTSHVLGWYSRELLSQTRAFLEAGIAPTPEPSRDHPQTPNTLPTRVFPLDMPRIGNRGAEEGINSALPIPCHSAGHSNTSPPVAHGRIPLLCIHEPHCNHSPTQFPSSSSPSIPSPLTGKGQRGTSKPWPSQTRSWHWLQALTRVWDT